MLQVKNVFLQYLKLWKISENNDVTCDIIDIWWQAKTRIATAIIKTAIESGSWKYNNFVRWTRRSQLLVGLSFFLTKVKSN